MTKNDIFVLGTIKKIEATNSLKSVPLSTLLKNTNLSATKVRSTLKLLMTEELIEEGYMQKNAKTYYITEKGMELLSNLYADIKNKNQGE